MIGSAADQNKLAITIAACHRAAFVNLQPNFGMAERRRNIGPAVAGNMGFADAAYVGCFYHAASISKPARPLQSGNWGASDSAA